jgi:hypothetical protein
VRLILAIVLVILSFLPKFFMEFSKQITTQITSTNSGIHLAAATDDNSPMPWKARIIVLGLFHAFVNIFFDRLFASLVPQSNSDYIFGMGRRRMPWPCNTTTSPYSARMITSTPGQQNDGQKEQRNCRCRYLRKKNWGEAHRQLHL